MFSLSKRPLHVLSNKLRRSRQPIEWMKEKWTADFSKPERSCFIIKPEISYNANLEKSPPKKSSRSKKSPRSKKSDALFLGLKRKNCMAWLDTENRVYVDQVIEVRFRFDRLGGYCAAGIMFRVAKQGTYYLALISSKGYFRLDAVNNNIPRTLIGWTETEGLEASAPGVETPGLNGSEVNLGMIARGDHFIFFLNGRWLAEANDDSISGGHLGFALVSYDSETEKNTAEGYTCRAWLDFLSVDSRAGTVKTECQKWKNNVEISAESRFRLAESFAALNCFEAAYDQILKIWKQREESARSVMATYTEARTRGELLFAARMASRLERYAAAEEYIDACLATGAQSSAKELDILAEKTQILSAQNKYNELSVFLPNYIKLMDAKKDHPIIPLLYALLGHACWNLQDYKAAAKAWDRAFSLDNKNGLYAANAANAFEMLGKNNKALQYCLDGAKCFLLQKNDAELEALVPKLLALGKNNRKALALAKKWTDLNSTQASERTTAAKKPAAKSASQRKTKPAAMRKTPVKKLEKTPAIKTKAKTVTARKPAAKPVAGKKTAAKPKAKVSGPQKRTKATKK